MSEIKLNESQEQLQEALSKRYLDYAISTITDRALPDVRDGLKPVHRRLLFAMRELKLSPKTAFKKCARVVGDVIGKYHPHGDTAVYEAMVRLAQDFSVRYPLVDGQGNFGNIDGDGAAAMRYTEARLTEYGEMLMANLDEDTVDFADTYDGSEREPVIMPAAFPNLLANGAMGIAVGMATNIAPHNVDELCKAIIALIKNPDTDVAKLVDYVKGPDFPTGGILTDKKEHIISVYQKGQGAFTIRCKWEKEELPYSAYQIVITEIPYGVVKSKLIEKIADLMEQKKLPLIADIRDESSSDLRVVIEPKSRLNDPNLIMAHLFKLTELEVKFNLNLNVLDPNLVPRVMDLKEVLVEFLNHRRQVLFRKSNYRLNNIARRIETLEGFLKAYLNLDRVIEIIRNNDDSKSMLMEEFLLTELQADAILNMRLRSLRKLEETEIQTEYNNLKSEQDKLKHLISTPENIDTHIILEQEAMIELMGKKTKIGKRRTSFAEITDEIIIDASSFIEKEPITVLLSKAMWIRAIKGHADLSEKFVSKDGDEIVKAVHVMTNEKLVIATDDGKFYTLMADKISRGKGYGEPLSLLCDINSSTKVIDIFKYEDEKLLIVNSIGNGFIVKSDDIIASTKSGKMIFNLDEKQKIFKIFHMNEKDDKVAVMSKNKKLLVFNLDEIPTLSKGKGVILQKYNQGDEMSDIITFNSVDGLYWTNGRGTTYLKDFVLWDSKRARMGSFSPSSFPKNLKFIS